MTAREPTRTPPRRFASWLVALLIVVPAAPAAPPNILFIAVDDLRPELGCYGKDYIKSPHIDALARAGLRFDRAYVQQAVCSPSRTSIMTGVRPDTSKVWDLVTSFRVALPDVVTLGQHFKQNGYFVQGMGKIYHGGLNDTATWSTPWQNPKAAKYALPENLKLDERQYAVADAKKKAKAAGEPDNTPSTGQNSRGPAFEAADVPDNALMDGKVADLAVATLRELSAKPEPFFLAVGLVKPHLPFVAPKKYWDLYDPAAIELAPNKFRAEHSPDFAVLPGAELRNYDGIPAGPLPDDLARRLKHGYYASISYMDAQLGRVLAELDRLDLRKNTIVVLWGDHGWKLGEHDAWCKHSTTENDTNAPLLVSVPGMKNAGAKSSALVEMVDLYPTLSELAGLPLPAHLEGVSLTPLLDAPDRPWKSAVFSQYPRSQHGGLMGYSMRTERHRLTVWVNRKDHTRIVATELYDHEVDPQENTNVADDPAQAATLERLMVRWRAGWQGAKPVATPL